MMGESLKGMPITDAKLSQMVLTSSDMSTLMASSMVKGISSGIFLARAGTIRRDTGKTVNSKSNEER